MTGLKIAPGFTLPLDAVTQTFAILAIKRAGKSNAAVVMAEEMYDAGLPWVAIDPKGDWWGVRAAGDGKAPGLSVLVFGGLHGDVPLEPMSGRLVADLIVEHRITCVLDVSEMTKADQRRFLIDFADRLYRTNREPLHVFCEEADEYIPQRVMGEQAKMVGVFETLVKRGGFRGIGITLITQRSASLNKDVLTQIETLIPMRTPSPQDRKAILAWVDYHAAGKDAVGDLPGLADGEAYVFSPQWLGTLEKIRFRRRRTFDSGATPKVGSKPRPPATLAEVDLGAIKEAMTASIEKAKADDPKHLRKEVARLQVALTAAEGKGAPEPVVETVEVSILTTGDLEHLASLAEEIEELRISLDTLSMALGNLRDLSAPKPVSPAVQVRPPQASRVTPVARAASIAPSGDGSVSPSRLKLLNALVSLESIGVEAAPRNQVALFAGVSPKSSGYANNLGAMNTAGLICYPSRGLVQITTEGRSHVDEIPDAATTEELHSKVRDVISEARWRILSPLLEVYPAALSREDLAQAAGVSPASSGYANNLGALRSLGLLDYPDRGLVVASDLLFI